MTTAPQHMQALAQANDIRIARANLKKRIRAGRRSITTALEDPIVLRLSDSGHGARGMTIGELLRAQQRWGRHRADVFLRPFQISPNRPVGLLTARQRDLIRRELSKRR